jgi:DNA primase catalytic core
MARIPEQEIERLKKEMSLVHLVESHGVKLEKKGKDLVGLCPFHDDKNPSLVITPDKNLWHCLGACGEGGSVIDWVMKTRKMSFRHAVETLREIAGVPREPPRPGPCNPVEPAFAPSLDHQKLLNNYTQFLHHNLKDNPEGQAYLEKRKLVHPELIDTFKLGLSNRTLGYRLPQKNRKTGSQIRRQLQEIGILRASGHEHFTGSVVIPIPDEQGNTVEMYGRKITPGLRTGTPLHTYLPGPHKGVFNFSALAASKEIILCEALIDALTFWCYGLRNVTSSYGVNGFTKELHEAFKKYQTRRIYIAYDNDDGGNKAAESLAKQLSPDEIECYRVKLPRGQDVNDYACKFKDRRAIEKAFTQLIKNAELMIDIPGVAALPGIQEEAPLTLPVPDISRKEPAAPPSLMDMLSAPGVPAAKEEKKKEDRKDISTGAGVEPEQENVPAAPAVQEISTEIKDLEILFTIGPRRWRVRGLAKNMSYDQLRVNIMLSLGDDFHVDNLDLYSARHRAAFIKQASAEIYIKEHTVKKDLGKVMMKLEELQDEQIKQAVEPQKKMVRLSEDEERAALALLRSPDLLNRILEDFKTCGIVGEETNKLVGYIATASRKMDKPLAVLIQSSSAAGKSSLMESILSFVPAEDRIQYSAMTGQSLYYMGETNLQHKILAIVEEEGAERASYALKLLQSEGELSIASTGKDPATGRLVTQEYKVQGPVMIFSTTTSIDIDEELQNRCIILTVNESREQTRAIHQLQREQRTLPGVMARHRKPQLLKLHQNAQRLLRPLAVINRYAPRLTFLDEKTRNRRDHEKYLSLIDSIALLYQYQRTVKTMNAGNRTIQYIEVTLNDIAIANRLANEVLGRSLDELPPQTRRFLQLIYHMVKEGCESEDMPQKEYRFSRGQISRYTGWSLTQTRIHLQRLVDQEYLLIHRGRRGQSFVYELLYKGEGKEGKPFLVGLIDVDTLRKEATKQNKKPIDTHEYDSTLAGPITSLAGMVSQLAGPKWCQNGLKTEGWRTNLNPLEKSLLLTFSMKLLEKAHLELKKKSNHTVMINRTLAANPLAAKIKKGA